MTVSESPEALQRFRKTQWKFQQTFVSPLKKLPNFVSTIVSTGGVEAGSLIISTWVFQPKHLIALLAQQGIEPKYKRGMAVTASSQDDVCALLVAGLSDWIDFAFVPQPKSFAIFADHDEYTTFYSQTLASLSALTTALKAEGLEPVAGFSREL